MALGFCSREDCGPLAAGSLRTGERRTEVFFARAFWRVSLTGVLLTRGVGWDLLVVLVVVVIELLLAGLDR